VIPPGGAGKGSAGSKPAAPCPADGLRCSFDLILGPSADSRDQGHRLLSVERTSLHGPVGVAVLDRETSETIRLTEVFRQRSLRLLEQLEQSFEIVRTPIGKGLRSENGFEKLLDRLLAMEPEDFVSDTTVREDGFEQPFVLFRFLQ
jgi:hypothetical protein